MNVRAPLPAGTRLVSLAERPDLVRPVGVHNGAVWPAFMLHAHVDYSDANVWVIHRL